MMGKEELEAFAREAAKTLKTEQDFNNSRTMLTKVTVEAALNAKLDDHLGYARHEQLPSENSRPPGGLHLTMAVTRNCLQGQN